MRLQHTKLAVSGLSTEALAGFKATTACWIGKFGATSKKRFARTRPGPQAHGRLQEETVIVGHDVWLPGTLYYVLRGINECLSGHSTQSPVILGDALQVRALKCPLPKRLPNF